MVWIVCSHSNNPFTNNNSDEPIPHRIPQPKFRGSSTAKGNDDHHQLISLLVGPVVVVVGKHQFVSIC